jgi:hypothetical protein
MCLFLNFLMFIIISFIENMILLKSLQVFHEKPAVKYLIYTTMKLYRGKSKANQTILH